MTVLVLKMTDAGLAAVQAASGTDPVTVAELGITATAFDYAPTLTALPGEFKRVDVLSGVAAAPNITHLTAYDTSSDVWTATGLGLFLGDGTLLGVVAGDEPLIAKAGVAFALLVFDIAFEADFAANIEFGDAVFTWPPTTETTQGVAELATQAEVNAGTDDQRIVTPLKLAARLAAVLAPFTAAIGAITDALSTFALKATTITGGGLVSGGGTLAENRTLTVTEASPADMQAGTAADKAVTPRRYAPPAYANGQTGYRVHHDGLIECWGVTHVAANSSAVVAFPDEVDFTGVPLVIVGAVVRNSTTDQENGGVQWPPGTAGFTLVNGFDFAADFPWFARGN
ncbi:hypothetical protein [Novosphingobium colocasiae]|uniref:hypothetical protein n=1 Tax=Novosphingobium colocasiae TaxID=1256513 RepID=UPI0035B2CE14